MPAYVIGDIRVTDPATYGNYVPAALASITQYGGKLLPAADSAEQLTGAAAPSALWYSNFLSPRRQSAGTARLNIKRHADPA